MCESLLSLPLSAGSSRNPTPVQKTELLRAGKWEMPENPLFPLGTASACIHLGPREKPPLSLWCSYLSPIRHLLHPSHPPLSLGSGHLPDTGNPEQGCLQAGLPVPFRSTLPIQPNMALAVCKHTRMCATHTKYRVIPSEGNAVVTVSACGFLSPITSAGLPSQSV